MIIAGVRGRRLRWTNLVCMRMREIDTQADKRRLHRFRGKSPCHVRRCLLLLPSCQRLLLNGGFRTFENRVESHPRKRATPHRCGRVYGEHRLFFETNMQLFCWTVAFRSTRIACHVVTRPFTWHLRLTGGGIPFTISNVNCPAKQCTSGLDFVGHIAVHRWPCRHSLEALVKQN